MRDYARNLQSSNIKAWADRGIDWRTGRPLSKGSSGRAPISQNVRGRSTSTGPGEWLAGGEDPLDVLRISAANNGRKNGIYSPDITDRYGNVTPGVRVTAPTDGAISGKQKIEKYKNAFQSTPLSLNTRESLLANQKTGLMGLANKYGRYLTTKDGFLVDSPTTQTQLDSINNNPVSTPNYYSDVRSKEFFDQYGKKDSSQDSTHGLNAPSVELGYMNDAARGQEAARYYNDRIQKEYANIGGKMPKFKNRYNMDTGAWEDVSLAESSGNPRLDKVMLERMRAQRGGPLTEQIAQRYSPETTSAMLQSIGYGSDAVSSISRDVENYKKSLDDKARTALSGISDAGDLDKNLSAWEIRKMQQEKQRDDTLALAEKQYDARKKQLTGAADAAKKKNETAINKQMEQRIAQLKATGQVVVDAAGNLTAGSQQLIDKIRGDFQDRLATLNGDIDTKLSNDQLTLDSDYFTQQQNATSKYGDYIDQLMAQEQSQTEARAQKKDEQDFEMMKLTIKNLNNGMDEKTANDLASELMKYQKLSGSEIRMFAPRLLNLLTQINGEQASMADINAWADEKDREQAKEDAKAAAKAAGIEPPSQAASDFLSNNPDYMKSYLSNAAKVGPAIEAYVTSPGYQPENKDSGNWFSGLWGGSDESNTTSPADSNVAADVDELANNLDLGTQ